MQVVCLQAKHTVSVRMTRVLRLRILIQYFNHHCATPTYVKDHVITRDHQRETSVLGVTKAQSEPRAVA